MAEYFYQGRNAEGRQVEGQLEAASQSALLTLLKRQSIIATRIEPVAKPSSKNIDVSALLGRFTQRKARVSIDELIMFCRQMYALSRSGIPLMRAINGLADATRSPRLG